MTTFKQIGAKQGYSLVNGLAFIPSCFFGINALLLSIVAIVSVNPIIIFIGLVICSDTLSITPSRHYPDCLFGLMSVVADCAKGTIVSAVTNAYSKFLPNNANLDGNISSLITSFSCRGFSNFSGGSLLQSIFSLFGLIDASTVGLLIHENDDGWKFTVAYSMMAVFFLCLELGQRHKWIKQANQSPDEEPSNKNTNESDL
ncbi:unnamed protein product [Adineta ricciae]|uniref:Uncharacterized protein n=1 Tax=Adineta ricciae TaxID=249248 RepID=A0A814KFH7_ADIRI|nr:unnamed protein product [Adineta ricciae]